MVTLAVIIHIMASVVIVIAVLLQVGKGAGIGSTFGGAGSQTLFGSAGPTTFLAKVTIGCAAIFMATSMFLTYTSTKQRSASIMSKVPAVTRPAPAQPAQSALPAQPAQAQPAQKQ